MTSGSKNNDLIDKFVNWNLFTSNVKEAYDNRVGYYIDELLTDELFICNEICCKNEIHKIKLDKIMKDFKTILFDSTNDFIVKRKSKFKAVPGWNLYCRD